MRHFFLAHGGVQILERNVRSSSTARTSDLDQTRMGFAKLHGFSRSLANFCFLPFFFLQQLVLNFWDCRQKPILLLLQNPRNYNLRPDIPSQHLIFSIHCESWAAYALNPRLCLRIQDSESSNCNNSFMNYLQMRQRPYIPRDWDSLLFFPFQNCPQCRVLLLYGIDMEGSSEILQF